MADEMGSEKMITAEWSNRGVAMIAGATIKIKDVAMKGGSWGDVINIAIAAEL
jgi:hypothetical protein